MYVLSAQQQTRLPSQSTHRVLRMDLHSCSVTMACVRPSGHGPLVPYAVCRRLTGIEDPDKAKQHQQQPHGATPPPQQVPAQGPGQMLGGVPGVAGGGGGMADPMGLGIMGGAAGPGPGGFGMPAFGGAGPRPPMGGGACGVSQG